MDLNELQARRDQFKESLIKIEQSYHIMSGHLAEVNFQIENIINASLEEEPVLQMENDDIE